MNKTLGLMASSLVLVLGTAGQAQAVQRFAGTPQNIGNGSLYVWGDLTDDLGQPLAIGVTFTASALDNLPTDNDPAPPGVWKGQLIDGSDNHSFEWELPFPQEVLSLTPFNHMGFNWNPHGHFPFQVYDTPHFDVHFYMISPETRHAITGTEPDSTAAPPPGFLPPTFFGPPGASEPRMGQHWVNLTAPELQPPPNNQPFTQTWIYGVNHRNVIFWEPMVTKAFFTPGLNSTYSISLPDYYGTQGYYPTTYGMFHDPAANTYSVTLSNFVFRQATVVPEPNSAFSLLLLAAMGVGVRLLSKCLKTELF
ncbi:DUF5602 domain-containing protein [Pannus brasiliensis CCIBt3594]|uniref:DUF5602 domain-containing protein n=1 Tax=Pannus brasiliensis CCIBt3594 TaxID=1427578 RepID=A0AAW9QZK6_9CHRO